jgi:hypothetical protein
MSPTGAARDVAASPGAQQPDASFMSRLELECICVCGCLDGLHVVCLK